MARFVLLRMDDEAAEKFVKKAGKRAVGVWEIPTKDQVCECPEKQRLQAKNWEKDQETGWWICKRCDGVSRPFLSIGTRLRAALGKNVISRFR